MPASEAARDKASFENARLGLLGNTYHCGAVAWCVGQLLFQIHVLEEAPSARIVRPPVAQPQADGSNTQDFHVRLVQALGHRQLHRGRDVRMTTLFGHPDAAPRQPLVAAWWSWRTVVSHAWRFPDEYINTKELRAQLTALHWRFRRPEQVCTRGLHGGDSQVVLGASAHGRTSSSALRPVLIRQNGLLMAASHVPLWGFFSTLDNPADFGSRRVRAVSESAP